MSIAESVFSQAVSLGGEPGVPERYRYTLDAFEALVEKGAFTDARVELLFGEIYTMPEMSPLHAALVVIVQQLLMAAYGPDFYIRTQLPFRVPPDSLPLPDVSVIAGQPIEHIRQHPKTARLVVEVCVSSQVNDRILKTVLYAAAAVPQYFILFPLQGKVEVYSDPQTTAGDESHFATMKTYARGERIPLLGALVSDIAVADFLPTVPA